MARYNGDSLDASSLSSPIVLNIEAASTTSLTAAPISVLFGQAVTLTATVTSTPTAQNGNVTFYDGATVLAAAPVLSGTASLTTYALVQGEHSLRARYDSNGSIGPSLSAAFNTVVVGSSSQIGFQPFATYSTTKSQAVVLGDLNGDGITDMAVGDGTDVDLFFGNSNGTFTPAANYNTGISVNQIAIADMKRRMVFTGLVVASGSGGTPVRLGRSHVLEQPAAPCQRQRFFHGHRRFQRRRFTGRCLSAATTEGSIFLLNDSSNPGSFLAEAGFSALALDSSAPHQRGHREFQRRQKPRCYRARRCFLGTISTPLWATATGHSRSPQTRTVSGGDFIGLTTGDLNGDGIPDVVPRQHELQPDGSDREFFRRL